MVTNLKNPQEIYDLLLFGLDAELQNIAQKMKSIPWLEKSFGRAKMIKSKDVAEPMVYIGKNDYISVLPNDNLKAYSFWGVTSPSVAKDETNTPQKSVMMETEVFCIVWADLKKIARLNDFIYTQELIHGVLSNLRFFSALTLVKVTDEKIEDIYRGYTLKPEHRDLLLYPHQAMRFDFKLNYKHDFCGGFIGNAFIPDLTSQINYVFNEIPAGAIDGNNAMFTVAYNFIPETVSVRINGLYIKPVDEFVTVGNNKIQLAVSLSPSETIQINYKKL